MMSVAFTASTEDRSLTRIGSLMAAVFGRTGADGLARGLGRDPPRRPQTQTFAAGRRQPGLPLLDVPLPPVLVQLGLLEGVLVRLLFATAMRAVFVLLLLLLRSLLVDYPHLGLAGSFARIDQRLGDGSVVARLEAGVADGPSAPAPRRERPGVRSAWPDAACRASDRQA